MSGAQISKIVKEYRRCTRKNVGYYLAAELQLFGLKKLGCVGEEQKTFDLQ